MIGNPTFNLIIIYSVNTIAVGRDDSSLRLYDLRAVAEVGKYKDDSAYEGIQSLAFSNSGRLLFSAEKNNKIRVWDVLTERKISTITGQHKDTIRSLSLSYDGSTLASAGKDGIVTLWED
jgi:WD40 repeat protein